MLPIRKRSMPVLARRKELRQSSLLGALAAADPPHHAGMLDVTRRLNAEATLLKLGELRAQRRAISAHQRQEPDIGCAWRRGVDLGEIDELDILGEENGQSVAGAKPGRKFASQ